MPATKLWLTTQMLRNVASHFGLYALPDAEHAELVRRNDAGLYIDRLITEAFKHMLSDTTLWWKADGKGGIIYDGYYIVIVFDREGDLFLTLKTPSPTGRYPALVLKSDGRSLTIVNITYLARKDMKYPFADFLKLCNRSQSLKVQWDALCSINRFASTLNAHYHAERTLERCMRAYRQAFREALPNSR